VIAMSEAPAPEPPMSIVMKKRKRNRVIGENETLARLFMVQNPNNQTEWTCICKKVLNVSKGYSNQVSHIKAKHQDWEQVLKDNYNNESMLDDSNLDSKRQVMASFVVPKFTVTIFFWLDWIVRGLLPFSFVASPVNREKAKQYGLVLITWLRGILRYYLS
jgi:hypothetical protein